MQLSTSGGSERGRFYTSFNYFDNNGILVKNFFKRYQARVNSEYSVKKHVRVGENFSLAYQTSQGGVGNPGEGSVIVNTYRMPGIVPVYDING